MSGPFRVLVHRHLAMRLVLVFDERGPLAMNSDRVGGRQNREERQNFEGWFQGKIAYVCKVDRPEGLKRNHWALSK